MENIGKCDRLFVHAVFDFFLPRVCSIALASSSAVKNE
jgi:hypothetical protein